MSNCSIKVAKFGGSSVADAIQMNKVKAIVEGDPSRRYIVVSAPGKRFDGDSKITDLLYLCKAQLENGAPCDQVFQVISDRYKSIEANLSIDAHMDEELQRIYDTLHKGASSDYIASRGEYLLAHIAAVYLGYDFVDTAGLVLFDAKGRFLPEETNAKLREACKAHEKAVFPGFYGTYPGGEIKTFSRGGSDITGSLVARAVQADCYENWTDVSGFLMADPRIVKKPLPIEEITYMELRELSYMGASVLHEDAIFPARMSNIPINIRNTNEPDHPGTTIVASLPEEPQGTIITGIAGRKDFMVIAIAKNAMKSDPAYIRRILSVFESYGVPVEHVPSGIDTLSVVVARDKAEGAIEDILEEISRKYKPDTMETLDDIAIIATVGRGMSSRPGTSAKLFSALAKAGINIRMIDQGSSEMNIIVGVNNDDYAAAVRAIYAEFVN